MGKFEENFAEPASFTDGTMVVTGELTAEQAALMFSQEIDEDVNPNELERDWVRFGFAPEFVEDRAGEACWYTGAGNKKGSKPVWVYGMNS
jgi:hypothetical protein